MQCPKCNGVVWFEDKCAACGQSRAERKPEPVKKAEPKPVVADSSESSS